MGPHMDPRDTKAKEDGMETKGKAKNDGMEIKEDGTGTEIKERGRQMVRERRARRRGRQRHYMLGGMPYLREHWPLSCQLPNAGKMFHRGL